MNKSPRVHTPAFKAQVALAALKGDRTLSEIAAQYQIHVKLVQVWKKQMFEQAATVFNGSVKPVSQKDTEAQQAELFEHGAVETEAGSHGRDLRDGCVFARNDGGRIARRKAKEEEHEHGHDPHDGDRREKPAENIGDHVPNEVVCSGIVTPVRSVEVEMGCSYFLVTFQSTTRPVLGTTPLMRSPR